MFKKFLGKSETTKADVIIAVAGAIIGVWKALDAYKDYQSDQLNKEINE